MKRTSLITVSLLMFAEYSFCQVLYTPGGTIGNNTTNQNVGIGTSTPIEKLEINGNIAVDGSHVLYNSTNGVIDWGGGGSGNLYFRRLTTQGNVATYNDLMILNSSGYLGIGTTSPSAKLSVGSSSQFQVNATGAIAAATGITSSGTIKFTGLTASKVVFTDASQNLTNTGTVTVGNGGTGATTFTAGILYGSGTNAITSFAIGTSNYLPKWSASSPYLTSTSLIYDNGTNIGIGTTSPTDKLHVYGAFGIHMATDKNLHINGWDINSNGAMCIMAVNDVNDASIPLNISASSVYFHSIVGIGTVNFNKNGTPYYKLAVCGPIKATEVVVETGWCDFVFDKDYKLKSLTEVEQYITQNKHLPDVPSAADVATNGVSLGQSDSVLLQKVEELTLYIIELNKRIETLEAIQKN